MTRRATPLFFLCFLAAACGADPGPGAQVGARSDLGPDPEPLTESVTPAVAEEPDSPAADAPLDEAPTRPEQLAWDLLGHVERAEVADETGTLLDFDGSRDGVITMGGFRSRLRSAELEGAHVVVSSSRQATLLVPWNGEGSPKLQIAARAFRGGATSFRLGDVEVSADLPTDASFRVVELNAGAALHRGLNALTITTRRSGSLDGVRAGFAIDWLRIGQGERTASPSSTPEGARMPSGTSLTWTLRCPAGGRLDLSAAGTIAVLWRSEEGEWRELPRTTREGQPASVDLAAYSGQLGRLRLRAQGQALLTAARIMVAKERSAAAPPPPVKHVLLYLIDTLRADHLRAYAPETRVETPGLTRFLRGATTFLDAHAQENWTKPSVATLLSSLFPWQHTATEGDSVLPRSVPLISEMLHARGFRTAAFIANGYVSDRFGFGRGWDDYRNYIREGRRTKAQYVASDVLSWLDAHGQEEHFFLYVHTIDPHVPYRPPPSFLERYGNLNYRGPVNFRHDATLLEHVKTGAISLGAADRAQLQALYDAEITYHDVHFDRIIDGLERRGLSDDTLVIVTADHGEEFWDHGSVGHGHSLYEELLHVPLFVRWPGLHHIERVEGSAGLVDVVPTIFDALGQEAPPGLAGHSLAPRLRGELSDAPDAVLSGFFDNQRAAVIDGLKVTFRRHDRIALYDLVADPHEQHDISVERPMALMHAMASLGRGLASTRNTRTTHRRRASAAQPARTASPEPSSPEPSSPEPEHTEIDSELAAQLRALGYVGTSAP